jgi:hypothetical protein
VCVYVCVCVCVTLKECEGQPVRNGVHCQLLGGQTMECSNCCSIEYVHRSLKSSLHAMGCTASCWESKLRSSARREQR